MIHSTELLPLGALQNRTGELNSGPALNRLPRLGDRCEEGAAVEAEDRRLRL